jgi:hypothetical protein
MVVMWKTFSGSEPGSYTYVLESEIKDSDSNIAVDIQNLLWLEVKNTRESHSKKHLSRALDNFR